MRIIVYGVGAIGGTIAAALALSGQPVVGIARGAQLEAIAERGLRLRTPEGSVLARFPCVSDPAEIAFAGDDLILLTMKSQDTVAALERLRMAGVAGQPIFCVQNGVANERFALRRFPEVHGVTVRMPSSVPAPGEVCAFSLPRHGICDIGRYPSGRNGHDDRLASALGAANIAAFVSPAVMESKYGKLLHNLHNIVEAALGHRAGHASFDARLRSEAEVVLAAAGIPWREVGAADPLRDALMRYQPIAGIEHSGTSTTQSLVRGAGSIETDYLNGEIVMLGRLHGVPVPVNAFFTALSARMVREKSGPGTFTAAQLETELAEAGPSA
ncbi:ketopantoate reductase family protein [Azospirillum doebereinerae]